MFYTNTCSLSSADPGATSASVSPPAGKVGIDVSAVKAEEGAPPASR
jgi:hypothetical protein